MGHFLVLYPENPFWAPVRLAALTDALTTVGFIGKERNSGLYSTGPEYLGLVTYLGCSPQVALGENEAATTIRIHGIFEAPHFLHGSNLKSPRCPQCRKPTDLLAVSPSADGILKCGHCGYAALPQAFDWRRSAAFGKVFIEISNVFESEVVPGEALTGCLEQATGEEWDYCYVRKEG